MEKEIDADFFDKLTNSVERRKLQTEYRKKLWNYSSLLNDIFDNNENKKTLG